MTILNEDYRNNIWVVIAFIIIVIIYVFVIFICHRLKGLKRFYNLYESLQFGLFIFYHSFTHYFKKSF